jgi:hypothetical protein
MEIIERGTPPEERSYEATCRMCNSIIKVKQSECEKHGSCNAKYLLFQCPVCMNSVSIPI